MNKPLRIGIIGCGYWGMNYVRLLQQMPGVTVVACDSSEERLGIIKENYPSLEVQTDYQVTAHSKNLDAAIISTNPASHHDIALEFLKAGVPLLIEKPITMTSGQAENLIRVAKEENTLLMVGHIFLFNPGIEKMREYIKQDALGQVYYLYAQRTNLGPIRDDVNVLWDLATHDISIFNFLLGASPLWVSAVGSNVLGRDCEDVGFIALGYPGNVLGHIHVSWADPNKVREVVIVGSEKRISFDDLNSQERIRVFEKGVTAYADTEPSSYGEYQLLMRNGDIISPHLDISEPLRNQVRHFIECVEENQHPRSDGYSGLEVVSVLEAADISMQNGGKRIEVKNMNHVTENIEMGALRSK